MNENKNQDLDAVKQDVKEELKKHRQKVTDTLAQIEQTKNSIKQLEDTLKALKNEVSFEQGVIQSLEFTIVLLNKYAR